MDRIQRADLESLLAPQTGPCVSLFMPMHPAGREGMQDPVRLRKLADEAEETLVDRGLRRPAARDPWADGRLRRWPSRNREFG